MTVKELIALLNRMPADATVVLNDGEYGYCEPTVFMDHDGEVVIDLA